VMFVPTVEAMYPDGPPLTRVHVERLTEGLCGASRPVHFDGVTTVVAKLFSIVGRSTAFFGRKDFQQLAVIRRMVADLAVPVEIVGRPTMREADGLAMSSRNRYLSAPDRQRAAALFGGLSAARALRAAGEVSGEALIAAARAKILPAVARLDYLELRDADTLAPIGRAEGASVMLVAAFIGGTRLIDNLRL
jgi:pantoate--beta-alanine ligase